MVAPLLRALMSIPRRPESRLILVPLRETRPPFYDLRDDYNVMLRGRKVGRIRFNHKTYPHEAHVPWRWFLNDMERNRMADGLCTSREEAMTAFREAFDRVLDNTIDRSA